MEQEELFNEIKNLKHRTSILSSYIQNDFNRLLNDGLIDKEQIKNSINDMQEDYDNLINYLILLKKQSTELMEKFLYE